MAAVDVNVLAALSWLLGDGDGDAIAVPLVVVFVTVVASAGSANRRRAISAKRANKIEMRVLGVIVKTDDGDRQWDRGGLNARSKRMKDREE